ncbi:MAG TPA: ATP-binding protein [Gemmatimonadaceae bacterium]|nr:ATP-binding protein [Gemmatimonadaceae bacterium]
MGALLESLAPNEAQSILADLASALFPSGIGDLAQVSWEAGTSLSVPSARIGTAEDERSLGDARLQAAELRYRTLVEQIPAVTFMAVLGEGQNEVYVSPHIEALLGFTQKEWLENPFLWYTQLHPDDRALWHEEFARGCRTGGPFRAECRLLARDGHIVWVRGEARLVKDELGRPLFLQGVAFDITDSKRAQEVLLREAVRTTEERYRDLVERLGAIFWEAEAVTGHFTFVSRGAEGILGFSPQKWLDDPQFWLSRVHQEDRERVRAVWQAALSECRDQEFEFRALTAADRIVWLHNKVHFSVTDVASPRPLGVILDISERKRAEEELQQVVTREQVARTEAETLNLVGRALAAELDLEQLVRLIADAGAELTGAEWAAFVAVTGKSGSHGTYVRAGSERYTRVSSFPRNDPLLARTFNGSTLLVADLHHDTQLQSAITRESDLRSFLGIPVISRDGHVIGGLFFGHSGPNRFTKRHERLIEGFAAQAAIAVDNAQLYDAAESARRAAEAANVMKDEFLATMSHELRTPLHAVVGWTHVLQAGGENEETRARGLAAIERNARAQSQIIEDLLDVSRIVAGKLRLEKARVDLRSVIEGALETIRFAADAKQIDVTTRFEPNEVGVLGDAVRLRQVVSNLLGNAVKFTPEGGRIDVTLERRDGKARITVADNGPGIDADFLPHVFERFRQADSSTTRAHGGLGLGLAIVRHLTELHGGRVRAESPGRGLGATFTVELPLRAAADTEEPPDRRTRGRAGSKELMAALKGARVLVVDDEADSRDVITSIFAHAGAQVAAASSVAEALRKIAGNPPDVVICDIGMPYEDGYVMIRRLRALGGAFERVPVAALTAYARAEDRQRAIAAGFEAHLGKPIEAEEVLATAAMLLTSRSAS